MNFIIGNSRLETKVAGLEDKSSRNSNVISKTTTRRICKKNTINIIKKIKNEIIILKILSFCIEIIKIIKFIITNNTKIYTNKFFYF
jgi:hypothetical protein